MSADIPKVTVLKSIAPSPESVRADQLTYNGLDDAVSKHAPYEYKRMDRFWDAEEGSLEEQEAARQLAMQYMLMGSLALQSTQSPELLSDRYTQATSEIYGTPDAELAKKLWLERSTGGVGETEQVFEVASSIVGKYIYDTYEPVFNAIRVGDEKSIDPDAIATAFEAGIAALVAFDPVWREWKVERNDTKDSLSVVPGNKKVIVGMRRASVTSEQLKGLFAHEILVHGLRGVNGSKVSRELGVGLPDYLDSEEGLGVFMEYAVSGKIPDKVADRYVDIAYALGQIDGQKHTREELIELATERALGRNELSSTKLSEEEIAKEVYAHVNRIYRGSRGDDNVGVFTKDISYYKGFMDMGSYITAELNSGTSVEKIMAALLSGKFDPLNPKHIEYLETHKPVDRF